MVLRALEIWDRLLSSFLSWLYTQHHIHSIRKIKGSPKTALLQLKVSSGYSVSLHCDAIRYEYIKGAMLRRRCVKSMYRVYAICSSNAPVSVLRKFRHVIHFPDLIGRFSTEHQKKRAAVDAYLELIVSL